MMPFPALTLCIVFISLAGLHLYWAFSMRSGLNGVIPTSDGKPIIRPGRTATLGVATLLATAAIVVVWRGTVPDAGPSCIPRVGIWVIALVFLVRAIGDFHYVGFFKRVRCTTFARNDTLVYSPLCTAISVLSVWLDLAY